MASGHGHSHGAPGHPRTYGSAFAIGIVLNLGFVGVEAIWGVISRLLTIVADAGA